MFYFVFKKTPFHCYFICRHVGVISGMVDTGTLPVNTSQKKTGWTMSSICNSKGSALKYLGKKPGKFLTCCYYCLG